MISKFIKFSFNVLVITLILVVGFEFSGALAQGLGEGGSGLQIPEGEVSVSDDIDKRPLADVILSMVNYFMGFLGFVAVIMFVYAGVLWVIAGGDEDQIGKAKKIMTYAAIGIIIVILSFSIVRFITNSAGTEGQQTCTVDSDCPNNGICNTENFCEAPQQGGNQCETNADCSQGLTCTNNTCQLAEGSVCLASKDCGTGQYCSSEKICKDGNSETCSVDSDCGVGKNCILDLCHNESGTSGAQCSNNTDCSVGYVCNLDENQCEIQGTGQGGLNSNENQGLTVEFLDKIDGSVDKLLNDLEGISSAIQGLSLTQELKDELDAILADSNLESKIEALTNFMQGSSLDDASLSTLTRLLAGLNGLLLAQTELEELKTVMPESAKTLEAWTGASDALKEVIVDPVAPLKLRQFQNEYTEVKELILTFPVMQSKIKATPAQGSAPFSVVLDGLDSVDPTGGTIVDYKWSFIDNTGTLVSLGNAPVVTHTFNEPNTYNVRLQVSTSNVDEGGYKVAMDGVSNILIKVNPPTSKIAFRVNGVEAPDIYSVTEEEAAAGLSFDPSPSVPGIGRTITKYEWFYGDATNEAPLAEPVPVVHRYDQPGDYLVTLVVTDNQGAQDKRVVKLSIKPLTAVIKVEPKTGDVNTNFHFMGMESRSDKGFVSDYQWQIVDTANNNQVVVENSEDNFHHRFETPGKYQVQLTITDSTGAQDKAVQDFVVNSRPPTANYNFIAPQANHPNVIEFDASESYDPDPGDQLTYSWDFDGDGQFEIVDGKEAKVSYTYRRADTFTTILQVQDAFGQRAQIQKDIPIESILSADMKANKKVFKVGEEVTFTVEDSNAVGYVWEFGDGQTQTTEEEIVAHTYTQAGKYEVKLNFFDREDNSNVVTYQILVGGGDEPIALAEVTLEGNAPPLIPDLCGEGFDGYLVHRSDNLTLSADQSLNTDGTSRLLTYDWTFSDGTKNSQKNFNYKFAMLNAEEECISVELKVRDDLSGKVSPEDQLYFKIENDPPTIRDFVIDQTTNDQGATDPGIAPELVTPTKVRLKIIGATDEDGQVAKYRWWYYLEGFEDTPLGIHSTSTPETEMIVTAQGEPGLKNKYFFVAEVMDNDGGVFDTTERYAQTAFLEIINGPNLSPVAAFAADKTTLSTGDSVVFVSQSYDPQGDVLGNSDFAWDFDGDGAFDDLSTGPQVTHQYNTPGEFEVRLRVTHRGLASTARQMILVQPTNSYPQASFNYSVTGNTVSFDGRQSVADKDLSAPNLTYQWDFDTQDDEDGNGINDDDTQSAEAQPQFTYGEARLFRAKLTVTDTAGMQGVSVRDVDLNLTSEGRLQRMRQTVRLKAPNQPITLLDLSVSPFQLSRGQTADLLATIKNADNSVYTGPVYFELLEGTGEFTPTPVRAVDSKAQTVFTAIESGLVRVRATATGTYFGDISEEININVQ